MLPDRESNPGPLTYESGALPIALRGPASQGKKASVGNNNLNGSVRLVLVFTVDLPYIDVTCAQNCVLKQRYLSDRTDAQACLSFHLWTMASWMCLGSDPCFFAIFITNGDMGG